MLCHLCYDSDTLPEFVPSSEHKVEMGIPPEAYDLDCDDDTLRAAVLQEFIIIDCKYDERLNDLEDEHEPALRCVVNCSRIHEQSHDMLIIQIRHIYHMYLTPLYTFEY